MPDRLDPWLGSNRPAEEALCSMVGSHVSHGKMHDVTALDYLPVEAGAFYVMDRGYADSLTLFEKTPIFQTLSQPVIPNSETHSPNQRTLFDL